MKIGIIGGGSIGLLFAGYLAEQHDVTIYTRTKHQASEINKNGVTIDKQNTSKTDRVQAATSSASVIEEDIVLFAVKQYILEEVLSNTLDLEKVHTVCFLQNGMSHINLIEKLKNPTILVGVVEHGALKVDETRVIHTGVGRTKIGVIKGKNEALEDKTPDFSIEYYDNWYEIVTSKLIANAVINPLTALFGVRNGELLENDYFHNQMKVLFDEIISVIPCNHEKMWELVKTICENTAQNKSSMLRDIEEGRKTEIDAILGYVLKEAIKMSKEAVITKFLYNSIKGFETKGG
ncbi:2-dehydropantoate 2-reductase [Fredinandcohnia sp. QZ13]|uniref:2-dehydropantoate 2-reductase n=1 Tax=Fredinandcohnia sp. QZ13 TaxID=3073144 RepID=UPI002852F7A4|nr:2-dehydropantoate 2-reductase [Fredinandcohnia sp. QZ13]MDR4886602.1 2-dehydropantoate 2-reductase [Fredinandcohnia sp. QZ13]